jgi:hypothetical protein
MRYCNSCVALILRTHLKHHDQSHDLINKGTFQSNQDFTDKIIDQSNDPNFPTTHGIYTIIKRFVDANGNIFIRVPSINKSALSTDDYFIIEDDLTIIKIDPHTNGVLIKTENRNTNNNPLNEELINTVNNNKNSNESTTKFNPVANTFNLNNITNFSKTQSATNLAEPIGSLTYPRTNTGYKSIQNSEYKQGMNNNLNDNLLYSNQKNSTVTNFRIHPQQNFSEYDDGTNSNISTNKFNNMINLNQNYQSNVPQSLGIQDQNNRNVEPDNNFNYTSNNLNNNQMVDYSFTRNYDLTKGNVITTGPNTLQRGNVGVKRTYPFDPYIDIDRKVGDLREEFSNFNTKLNFVDDNVLALRAITEKTLNTMPNFNTLFEMIRSLENNFNLVLDDIGELNNKVSFLEEKQKFMLELIISKNEAIENEIDSGEESGKFFDCNDPIKPSSAKGSRGGKGRRGGKGSRGGKSTNKK